MTRRALRYPQTSAKQSFNMYDTGNMMTAPGSEMFPIANTFVANRFDAMRQTVKRTAINKNTIENFCFII